MAGGLSAAADVHSIDELHHVNDLSVTENQDVTPLSDIEENSLQNDKMKFDHSATHCGHGCAHSHMFCELTNHPYSVSLNTNKRFFREQESPHSRDCFGLKRPPRTFA